MTDTTTDTIEPVVDEAEEAANAFRWAAAGLRDAAADLDAGNTKQATAGLLQAAEGLEFLAAAIYSAEEDD